MELYLTAIFSATPILIIAITVIQALRKKPCINFTFTYTILFMIMVAINAVLLIFNIIGIHLIAFCIILSAASLSCVLNDEEPTLLWCGMGLFLLMLITTDYPILYPLIMTAILLLLCPVASLVNSLKNQTKLISRIKCCILILIGGVLICNIVLGGLTLLGEYNAILWK